MQETISNLLDDMVRITIPVMGITDVIEIFLISFFVYRFVLWIKDTRAYTLLKGILTVGAFILVAYILRMNTILWLFRNLANVLIIGLIVIFQPELRRVLEQLGQRRLFAGLMPFETEKEVKERFTDRTINELDRAVFDMGAVKTGALIVIELDNSLTEFERTGIVVDAVLTSQLLINIFEKNTPLHDGAVIVRGNRVAAATCYLPLSDNMELSKQLGTRHRAGVGISEVSDSLTIIVSEETGHVSIARKGKLSSNITSAELKAALAEIQDKKVLENNKLRQLLKGKWKK